MHEIYAKDIVGQQKRLDLRLLSSAFRNFRLVLVRSHYPRPKWYFFVWEVHMLLELDKSSKPSRELFLSLQKQLNLIANKKWSSVLLALKKGSRELEQTYVCKLKVV